LGKNKNGQAKTKRGILRRSEKQKGRWKRKPDAGLNPGEKKRGGRGWAKKSRNGGKKGCAKVRTKNPFAGGRGPPEVPGKEGFCGGKKRSHNKKKEKTKNKKSEKERSVSYSMSTP